LADFVSYDPNRPFWDLDQMSVYEAINAETAKESGPRVKAMVLSNVQYMARVARFGSERRMRSPQHNLRVILGYLVVRRLGTPRQYETWMTEDLFEELYREASGQP
jgi:hypothetical protein